VKNTGNNLIIVVLSVCCIYGQLGQLTTLIKSSTWPNSKMNWDGSINNK
jgi:hypothetical protein